MEAASCPSRRRLQALFVGVGSDLNVSAVRDMMGFSGQTWRLPVVHCEDVYRRVWSVWFEMIGGTLVNMRSDLHVSAARKKMEFARQICSDVFTVQFFVFAHVALAEDLQTSHGHSSGTPGITHHRHTNKERCFHTTKTITKITISLVRIGGTVFPET